VRQAGRGIEYGFHCGVCVVDSTPNNTPLVRVDWEDIQCTDRWEDDGVDPAECSSTGYLVDLTPVALKLAGGYSWQDGRWGWMMALPRGCIQMVRVAWAPGMPLLDLDRWLNKGEDVVEEDPYQDGC